MSEAERLRIQIGEMIEDRRRMLLEFGAEARRLGLAGPAFEGRVGAQLRVLRLITEDLARDEERS